jgi:hypothetical protein
MIFRTKYGRYIDENNVEVSETDLRNYLQSGGIITPTNFIFPEDEAIDNRITFAKVIGDYFGTVTEPKTGTLTFDMTNAVIGGIAVVYYNNSTLSMPSCFLQIGTFAPNVLNKIYLERDSEGNITANIVNDSGVTPPSIPAAPTNITLVQSEIDPSSLTLPPTNISLIQTTF